MRHMVDGRKFGINTPHRKAMFKAMANNLIRHEHLITTVHKAKELRRVADRLITLGKQGTLHARRLAFDRTRDRDTVVKLFGPLAERYAKRAGGYTRVLHMDSTRWGDAAEMAIIELVDRPILERRKKTDKKKVEKKATAAAQGHDHDHDHDHDHGHAHAATGSKGKVSAASTKAKGVHGSSVRKTPTKTGGGRSGGSS